MLSKSNLTLESSLQVFFFDLLQELNKKSFRPLPGETIFYSSLVMDQFGDASKYFEKVEGKTREKILGIKLLESTHMPKEKMKSTLKDIAETSLLACGYFSDSLNRKIIDTRYYQELGMIAYSRLNSLEPKAYNVNSFYQQISYSFSELTMLISLAAKNDCTDKDQAWLILNKRAV